MEHGFFHPDRGYWQTTNEPSPEVSAAYPEGTITVPLKPGADYEWQDDEWVATEVDPSVLKQELKAAVDAAAEVERSRYITPGAGQAMTYQRKSEEARSLKAALAADTDLVPNPADYPMLAASIGIDGLTLEAVADTVIDMHDAWLAIGSAIEGVRLAAKRDIDAAETAEDAQGVFDSIEWPST